MYKRVASSQPAIAAHTASAASCAGYGDVNVVVSTCVRERVLCVAVAREVTTLPIWPGLVLCRYTHSGLLAYFVTKIHGK